MDTGEPQENAVTSNIYFGFPKKEEDAIRKRKENVAEAIKKLLKCKDLKVVPTIAVLGSGGGLRAMTSLLGTLKALNDVGLLDCVTYLCGVSGSTWCMSSIYCKPDWSDFNQIVEAIRKQILNETVPIEEIHRKLEKAVLNDTLSLTDFWAVFIAYMTIHQINTDGLSSQWEIVKDGEKPLPIYAAVTKDITHETSPDYWFEMTPDHVGFTAYNAFIDTDISGSQFDNGRIIKKNDELDVCYLQGLFGSALADADKVWNYIVGKISPFSQYESDAINGHNQEENGDILNKGNEEDAFKSKHPEHISGSSDQPKEEEHTFKSKHPEHSSGSSDQPKEEESSFLSALAHLMGNGKDENEDDEWESDNIKPCSRMGIFQLFKILVKFILQSMRWDWGKLHNFLYNYIPPEESRIPNELLQEEFIYLKDAGLLMNSAYPLVLCKERDVDLILSFDFSEDNPFTTVIQAKAYCDKNNLEFPNISAIEQADKNNPDDCYTLAGNSKPRVMHFPLFNSKNCKDCIAEFREMYRTSKHLYSQEEFDQLLDAAGKNVKNNTDNIIKHICDLAC